MVETRINTGCFMDAVTASRSMPPATPHTEHQKNRYVRVKTPVKVGSLLRRCINIAEHTATPCSLHCKYCLSVLTTKRTFREHINRCHTKDVLFLCNHADCSYNCFSFLSLCSHDRRYHNSIRNFSVGFRRSEIMHSQPTLYEIVAFSKDQSGRCQWAGEDNLPACLNLPNGGQTWANNGPPVSHLQRPGNISQTPLPPLPDPGAQSTDSVCAGDDQARERNGSLPAQRSGNIDSPLPSGQVALGADQACPAFEPTDKFREIFHIFKQKLDTLHPATPI